MNIIKIFSVFLVLMAVAFFTIPAQVEGRAVKLKIDYDEIWPTIWCLPENLYVTGTANVVVVYNEDAQGCIHWLIHVNGQQLNAVGVDTGQEYVVMFAGKDATGLPPDPYPQGKVCGDEPPYVFIFNFDVRIILPGEGLVILNHYNGHLYIDENYEPKVNIEHQILDCRPPE